MLEKNKDYVEFTLQCTTVERTRDKDYREVCFNGYSDYNFPGVPMDVVCKDFNHKVIMISKSDFEALQKENEELKKKLHEPDPFAEYKELLEKLYSKDDVEKLEWTLNHICGGRASVNGWIAVSSFWKQDYEKLSKLVGFSSVEEIQDYLTNEAECDTLHEAIHMMCKEMDRRQKKIDELRDDISGRSTVIESYKRDIEKWQKETGCPSPAGAKSIIESAISWHHAYNEVIDKNRKLTEEVDSWKHVTGYSTPEDYMHARINNAIPFDYTAAWQKATGCDTPDAAKAKINDLTNEAATWESDYNHLLALTGFDNEGEIEDFLEQNNDRNKLTTVIDNLIQEIDKWQNVTGFSSPKDYTGGWETIRRLCEEIHKSYGEKREQEWQKATGCDTPRAAEKILDYYKSRLGNAVQAASCASKHLNNITF